MAIEIVVLPIKHGDFPSFLYVYQSVNDNRTVLN